MNFVSKLEFSFPKAVLDIAAFALTQVALGYVAFLNKRLSDLSAEYPALDTIVFFLVVVVSYSVVVAIYGNESKLGFDCLYKTAILASLFLTCGTLLVTLLIADSDAIGSLGFSTMVFFFFFESIPILIVAFFFRLLFDLGRSLKCTYVRKWP